MQDMTPITPLEPGVEMFQRAKSNSFFFQPRAQQSRPLSEATEIDTEFEDDSSDFEEDSPKYSFESEESRQSQTTLSSFDEVITPQSGGKDGFQFVTRQQIIEIKPVEGPKGPHLFRSSQTSLDFDFEFALQMSPLLPKEIPLHPEMQVQTPATVIAPRQHQFSSIGMAITREDGSEVRLWTAQQVASWMYRLGFEETVIEKFEAHDITGQVLLDMQFEDLRELDITSFGKRHQLWAHIESLRVNDGRVSPVPTPFLDLSRPATRIDRDGGQKRERSKSRHGKRERARKEACEGDEQDQLLTPITPGGGRRRRGRKHRNPHDDIITPAESISIVAIEQLLPKPHKCAKGERCAKWRKQQRQLERLQKEHGFPISPEKGGHIFIAGDPGNAGTASKVVDHVYRPTSENVPSVVASSAALPPEHMAEISLQEEMLQYIESRDPQENVKQFLSLQRIEPPEIYHTPVDIDAPPTPPLDLFPPLQPPSSTQAPHANLKSLPKLSIPRSSSADAEFHTALSANPYHELESAFSPCRTAVSPIGNLAGLYRFGTPATEMDVPLTAIPADPFSRDNSQSVPPNMQYREQTLRTTSRVDWRRPSFALPALQEGQVFSPVVDKPESAYPRNSTSSTLQGSLADAPRPTSPQPKVYSKSANNSPNNSPRVSKPIVVVGHDLRPPNAPSADNPYHYPGVVHSGWMKKRRTKLLRHEWNDAHFRLNGTLLSQHSNALPSSNPLSTIDVDDYAVACSSLASNKLSAKLRALRITSSQTSAPPDAAFSFQLVPCAPEGYGNGDARKKAAGGKTHHFAVKSRDERIDWMRELMLAKALKAKGEGYEVQVNGTAM